MKKKFLIISAIILLIATNKVNAACSQYELDHFKEIESQYKATYYYDEAIKEYVIEYYMPEPDRYKYQIAISTEGSINCDNADSNTIKCHGKDYDGEQILIILGSSKTCNDELKREIITIPKHVENVENKYYGSSLCEGIEEFALCQKDYDKELTEEEFTSRVESYKKSLSKNNSTNNDKNNGNTSGDNNLEVIFDNILEYIQDHLITIIVGTIFVILLIITIVLKIKSIRKSRYLEW